MQSWLGACRQTQQPVGGAGERVVTAERPQEALLAAPHSEFSPSVWDKAGGRWGSGASSCFAGDQTAKEDLNWGAGLTSSLASPPQHCPGARDLWGPDGLVKAYLQEGALVPWR